MNLEAAGRLKHIAAGIRDVLEPLDRSTVTCQHCGLGVRSQEHQAALLLEGAVNRVEKAAQKLGEEQ